MELLLAFNVAEVTSKPEKVSTDMEQPILETKGMKTKNIFKHKYRESAKME